MEFESCPALDLVTGNMIPFADRKVNCCFRTKTNQNLKELGET